MELFNIREVAAMLKISTSSMYRLVENGKFPHRKIGSNIRFSKENIEVFLSEPEVKQEKIYLYPQSIDLNTVYDQIDN